MSAPPLSAPARPPGLAAFPGLLRSEPDLPDALDPDARERYAFAAERAARLCSATAGPVRVLEVGGDTREVLPGFFEPERVAVTRGGPADCASPDPAFVLLDPAAPLPFADDSFDVVVALDVLENLPAERRGPFLAECVRVGRRGAVLACPDGSPEVAAAEGFVAGAALRRTGRPHPTLSGRPGPLPDADELRRHLQALDRPFAAFDGTPLDLWLAAALLGEPLTERLAVADVWRHLRDAAGSACEMQRLGATAGDVPYRRFYVVARAFDATAALEPLPTSAAVYRATPAEEEADPARRAVVAGLARMGELAGEVFTTLDARRHHERHDDRVAIRGLQGQVGARARAEIAWHQRAQLLDSVIGAICHTWSWRLTAPMRFLARKLLPGRFDHTRLIAWGDVEPLAAEGEIVPAGEPAEGPDGGDDSPPERPTWLGVPAPAGATWRATGGDPQFVLPALVPAGWTRIRIKVGGTARGVAELYVDEGEGFHPGTCLESIEWLNALHVDFVTYLRKPVRGFRLDPLNGPGTFRIDEFSVRSLPLPHALAHALGRKWTLLTTYGCTLPALWRGLRMLLRGEFRGACTKLFKAFPDDRKMGPVNGCARTSYDAWRRFHALTDADRKSMRREAEAWPEAPLVSVLMPTYNTPAEHLTKAIDSVRRQTYPRWQLCVADDGSTDPKVRQLLEKYAARDPRIRVAFLEKNGGISAATNRCLEMAEGPFVALLDHDDELAEQALFRVAEAIRANPRADFFYTDEDKIDSEGRHINPFFKPDWAPEFFLTCMYTCHLGVYRTELARRVGGFRSEFDTAQDYDLALRVVSEIQATTRRPDGTSDEAERIVHVPDVLYHWRMTPTSTALNHRAKPNAAKTALRAVQSYLDRAGRGGKVEPGPSAGLQRVRFPTHGRPKVSIVIPSAGRPAVVHGRATWYAAHCVESIRRRSTYANYEIVVVDNDDMAPALRRQLDMLGAVRVPFTGPFNLSEKINLGAAKADGEYLLLLNDDTEVIAPDWIESMLEYGQFPEIGAVGAKLLFADGNLQHAGVTFVGDLPVHHFYNAPGDHPGYWGGNILTRNYSAVTGACLLVRAETFHAVGGFDPAFPLNYNDIDFCLKVIDRNLRIVYQPYAKLYHFESVSKEGTFQHEIEAFIKRWGGRWACDPMYNPHLSRRDGDYRIGIPEGKE